MGGAGLGARTAAGGPRPDGPALPSHQPGRAGRLAGVGGGGAAAAGLLARLQPDREGLVQGEGGGAAGAAADGGDAERRPRGGPAGPHARGHPGVVHALGISHGFVNRSRAWSTGPRPRRIAHWTHQTRSSAPSLSRIICSTRPSSSIEVLAPAPGPTTLFDRGT